MSEPAAEGAGRFDAGFRIRPDPERLAQGWEPRFVADDPRASEMAALYRSLGYEVAVDPVRPGDLNPACGECPLVTLQRLKIISTRRTPAP